MNENYFIYTIPVIALLSFLIMRPFRKVTKSSPKEKPSIKTQSTVIPEDSKKGPHVLREEIGTNPVIAHLNKCANGSVYAKGYIKDYDLWHSLSAYYKMPLDSIRRNFDWSKVDRGYYRTLNSHGNLRLIKAEKGKKGAFYATIIPPQV